MIFNSIHFVIFQQIDVKMFKVGRDFIQSPVIHLFQRKSVIEDTMKTNFKNLKVSWHELCNDFVIFSKNTFEKQLDVTIGRNFSLVSNVPQNSRVLVKWLDRIEMSISGEGRNSSNVGSNLLRKSPMTRKLGRITRPASLRLISKLALRQF